jgi:mRNA-degrading endonuclease RelE of RelBE toxin-antitoxin system
MKGIFVESKLFEKYRQSYLTENEYQTLQYALLLNPKAGDVIKSTGGLRKIRSSAKGKGKRSGVRVIYYYFDALKRFYLLTLYAKNEVIDLSPDEKHKLKIFMETWKNEQT